MAEASFLDRRLLWDSGSGSVVGAVSVAVPGGPTFWVDLTDAEHVVAWQAALDELGELSAVFGDDWLDSASQALPTMVAPSDLR